MKLQAGVCTSGNSRSSSSLIREINVRKHHLLTWYTLTANKIHCFLCWRSASILLIYLTIVFSILLIVEHVCVVAQKVLHKLSHIEISKLILFWVVTHHYTKLVKLLLKHHLTYKCLNFFLTGKFCKVVVSMYI